MNLIRITAIVLCAIMMALPAYGQQDTIPEMDTLIGFQQFKICKSGRTDYFFVPALKEIVPLLFAKKAEPALEKPRASLLKVSGNILYDVNYRSRIDTPYAESDIYQHTLQTRLDFLYKDKYPFRVYLTARFSNTPLFRNYADLNFQFSQPEFKRVMKTKLMEAVTRFMTHRIHTLDSLKIIIDQRRKRASMLGEAMQGNMIAQRIVEKREREYYRNSGQFSNVENGENPTELPDRYPRPAMRMFSNKFLDSLDLIKEKTGAYAGGKLPPLQLTTDTLAPKRVELDSVLAQLDRAEILYRNLKNGFETDMESLRKRVNGAKDMKVLSQKLREAGMPDTIFPKGYKVLSAIQSFGIGRGTADYSELSVKNISITGMQIEYNPRYYYAVAVGKVDYRYRDYIIPAQNRSRQYLALARFGKGTRNGNHIFFTYYTGKRQFFNSSTMTQTGGSIPEYSLAGFTIEGVYNITRNVSVIAEAAKSTVPYYSLDSLQKSNWLRSVTKFSDRKNEAYAAKLLAYLPKSGTRFTANIRYTGANFQSFSTFTSGASQLRWKGRVEQSFFKRQITFTSSVEQNDYINPFVNLAYRSSAIMASFQANLRFKKWPVISVGYYPSFQLVKTGDDQYSESRYYTLSGSAGYYYKMGKAQAGSAVVYSRFYNDVGDSGFVYYNSTNWLLTQNVNFAKCSFATNASVNRSSDYRIWSLENNIQLSISKVVSLGAGVKMIRHSLLATPDWGYSGNITIKVPRLGEVQVMTDKGFIPGMNRQLVENRMGRLIYYKTF